VTYNTLRTIRSAAVAYTTFAVALFTPSHHYRDSKLRLLGAPYGCPAGNIATQLALRGMAARMGTGVIKSSVLRLKQV